MPGETIDLDLKPAASTSARRAQKPALDLKKYGLVGEYRPSADGVDSNILIMFHGLGDTQLPFASLATSLRLPQTATLSLRAPLPVPLLDFPAYQWWESFDMVTGDTLPHPNPTNTLAKLLGLLEGLTSPEGGWRGEEIHLFGFAQGGSCAAELALTHHRKHPPSAGNPSVPLGSLVVISAPLLSLPTIDVSLRSQIPALLFLREGETNLGRQATGSGAEAAFTKGFKYVEKPKVPSSKRRPGDEGERMPAGQDEWRPIMTFWAKHLKRRHPWEVGGTAGDGAQVYEVTSRN